MAGLKKSLYTHEQQNLPKIDELSHRYAIIIITHLMGGKSHGKYE